VRIAAPGSFRFLLVGTLAYYDAASDLCGVLFHYEDQVDIAVSPGHRRQGVGLALWNKAAERWGVVPERQKFTPEGAEAANDYLGKRRG
jgi:GNAT superfamily N-acetyltransferase